MKRNDIWQAIELELRKEKKRSPSWPDHVAAQAGTFSLPWIILMSCEKVKTKARMHIQALIYWWIN